MYSPTSRPNTGMTSNYSAPPPPTTTTPAYATTHNSTKKDALRCEISYDGESLLFCIIITTYASIFLITIMAIMWLKQYKTLKRRIRSLQDTQRQAMSVPSAETDPLVKQSSGPEQIITVQLEQNAISASEFKLQSMKSALIKVGREGVLYKTKMTRGAIKGRTMFTCKIYKKAAQHNHVKKEVMIMLNLSTHMNLLQLVDWDITEVPYMLIMEDVEHGSLRTFLKMNKESLCKDENLQHLFTIALYHIAQAMDHLHSKMILHCDLALRNIMVHRFPHEVKVAEFGLARDITRKQGLSGNCKMTDNKRVPFRWYPPEYFKHDFYGFKGDVWAFGIIIWEMQTFGTIPYPDLKTSNEVVSYVRAGHRNPEPEACRPEILPLIGEPNKVDARLVSSSSAYPGPGRGGSSLSMEAQTSLSPDTSASSSGRTPRRSQASRET
ncbi:fibroblast growth factor receptor homolog 1-like isoform X2 [Neoarius graeffei]|uniref:fibroblast growth factor receptor homolog 1-like isoform X2 n=1 Tax=Neoarius graeffei TaxID=443677 RepID=UPI00298CBEC7|nr:fibroblast growth factor receptor homolog 1-like isoform X2 [Neoarius graeffei]